MNETQSLATLYIELKNVRDKIYNQILPLAAHLGCEDESMLQTLELAASATEQHLRQWKLVAEKVKTK